MVDEFLFSTTFTLFNIKHYASLFLVFITNTPEATNPNAIATITKEFLPPVCGISLAFTVTFIVKVVSLLSLSVTLYVTLYFPAFLVFTVFSTTLILEVKSPSSLSDAVTPFNASNLSPTFNSKSSALITGFSFVSGSTSTDGSFSSSSSLRDSL